MALTRTVLDALTRILGPDGVISSPEGRLVYECDMQTFYKGAPDVVALPESAEQVEAIVRLCRRERVPVVPRGSGSGLIGGGMAPAGGGAGGSGSAARSRPGPATTSRAPPSAPRGRSGSSPRSPCACSTPPRP